jgi:hypothetical protein
MHGHKLGQRGGGNFLVRVFVVEEGPGGSVQQYRGTGNKYGSILPEAAGDLGGKKGGGKDKDDKKRK